MQRDTAEIDLPSYAVDLLGRACAFTGYPIVVGESPSIQFDSEVQTASRHRPFHAIIFQPQYEDHLLHFIVNGAFKLCRFWEVQEGHRQVPAHEGGRRLPADLERELESRLPGLPTSALRTLSAHLHSGMARQVTSMPIDLRVERELAGLLPEHRGVQNTYLELQVTEFLPLFTSEKQVVSPPLLYRAASAMNYAFATEAAQLSSANVPSLIRESPNRDLGKLLHKHLHARPPGYEHDCGVVDSWAQLLNLEGWFKWTPWSPGE